MRWCTHATTSGSEIPYGDRRMKLIRHLGLVLAATLAMAAAHAQTPKAGGALNLIVQPEPPGINLGNAKLGPSSFVGSKIYEGLVSLSPKLEPIPRLAE